MPPSSSRRRTRTRCSGGSEFGHGTGRALYAHLFEVLADLGYVSVFAGITLPNPASVALHAALGFEPVGIYRGVGFKLGAWRDVQVVTGVRARTPPAPSHGSRAGPGTAGLSERLAG